MNNPMLRNITIARKIPAFVAVFAMLPIICTLILLSYIKQIHQGGDDIYHQYMRTSLSLNEVRSYSYEQLLWMNKHVQTQKFLVRENAMKQVVDAGIKVAQSLENLLSYRVDETNSAGIKQLNQDVANLTKVRERVLKLSRDDEQSQAEALIDNAYQPLFASVIKQLELMISTNNLAAQNISQEAETIHDSAVSASTIVCILVVLIAIFIGWTLINSIQLPLVTLKKSIASITQSNNLSESLPVNGEDEISALCIAFNEMMQSLRDVLEQMNGSSTILQQESALLMSTVSSTNRDLHASSLKLDEVQHSTGEITLAIHEIAKSANNASAQAERSKKHTQVGIDIQTNTVNSVRSLKESMRDASDIIAGLSNDSDTIGSVLDVIKGIAEQTNLLALNAAIEAARAGEQGRGFAVVADEVRTLAQRTQESTSEIQEIIEKLQAGAHSSVDAMGQCVLALDETVGFAHQAEGALGNIDEIIDEIALMNEQIATAIEEQSLAVKEISDNVVVANNFSEKSTDSFAGLKHSSEQMGRIVSTFEKIMGKFRL